MRLLILAVFALFCVAHCEDGARLLLSKSQLNGCAVRTGPRGTSPAPLVPVTDLGASGVSHAAVLRPLEAGYFNFTSATTVYLAQEGGQATARDFIYPFVQL